MSRSDRETIEQCLNGHPETYRQLVRRYQGSLLSFLAAKLGSMERAEEAGQETFVRAYFALDKLRKRDSFPSWLYGIASRVALETARNSKRHAPLEDGDRAGDCGDRAGDCGDRAGDCGDRAGDCGNGLTPPSSRDFAVEKAVAALPEPCRAVVHLRFYSGLSCAEIAERLDVAPGTVTKNLSRAYAMLRESLPRQDSLLRQVRQRAETSEVKK